LLTRPLFLACLMVFSGLCVMPVHGERLPFSIVFYPTWGIRQPGNMSGFKDIGFDGFYYNGYWKWDDPDAIRQWAVPYSLACAKNNMTFIAGLYWYWCRGEEFKYAHAVDQFGHRMKTTPSPVSEDWWREMMEAPAVYLANLSLQYPIWGVVWDTEDYSRQEGGVWVDFFQRGMYSFDDEAMGGFAQDTGRTIPDLPLERRRDWLRSNGLLEEFQAWEENRTYELSKRVADRVYAINPNFTLGIFPVEDDWWLLAILKGFSARAGAGAWTGSSSASPTYDGISRELAETYRAMLEEEGIDATLVAGIGGWIPLSRKEAAVRYCDAIWVYGSIPWYMEDEIRVLRQYIFFNRTHADMLPAISFGPDIGAHPYLSPDGIVSVMLVPYEAQKTMAEGLRLLASGDVTYIPEDYGVGRNASMVELKGPNPYIPSDRLPCLIQGLEEDELLRTGIWYLSGELANLSLFYSGVGLGELPGLEDALKYAAGVKDENPDAALARLSEVREQVYPMILQAVNHPGNLSVPPSVRASAWIGQLMISKGQVNKGQMYLFEGMRDWYAADETGPLLGVFLLLPAAVSRLRGRRASKVGTSQVLPLA